MDFRRLSKIDAQAAGNDTEPLSLTGLPSNLLEALIPGYPLISKFAQGFGVDISLYLSIAVIFVAVTKGGQWFLTKLWTGLRYLFVSTAFVDESDDLFDYLMDYLSSTQTSSSRRSVRAKTRKGNDEFDGGPDEALDSDGMFDYNKWSARTPPRYEPYYGRHVIWHNGRPFMLRRSQKAAVGQSLQVRFGNSSEDDVLQLDCLGRSIAPIQDLLRTVKVWSLLKKKNTTTIRHPTAKDRARFSGSWSKTTARPSRPMETVILDAEQKSIIVNDMNEFLHPTSPKWYATRGIPYRRGYLFHGPPGTGKTSLSFALAGIFGLEIYVISLQEPTLTEADLMQLFNSLPKRCIVLLEDVDAAGLIRSDDESTGMRRKQRKEPESKEDTKSSKDDQKAESDAKPAQEAEYTLKDLAKELKSISTPRGGSDRWQGNSNKQPGTGISLSGLLNAIDGVASHEGRVLIMTTNHPEKLDAALVRPGRVDRRVQFALAKKPQIEELFFRMYVLSNEQVVSKPVANGAANGILKPTSNGHAGKEHSNGQVVNGGILEPKKSMPEEALHDLAVEFASYVPDDTFTPAEIQNHLMRYKNEPRKALDKVDEWMKEATSAKYMEADDQEDDAEDD